MHLWLPLSQLLHPNTCFHVDLSSKVVLFDTFVKIMSAGNVGWQIIKDGQIGRPAFDQKWLSLPKWTTSFMPWAASACSWTRSAIARSTRHSAKEKILLNLNHRSSNCLWVIYDYHNDLKSSDQYHMWRHYRHSHIHLLIIALFASYIIVSPVIFIISLSLLFHFYFILMILEVIQSIFGMWLLADRL